MKTTPTILIVLTILLSFGIQAVAVTAQEPAGLPPEEDPNRLFEPREFADDQGNVLPYRLLKPLDYDPNEKYPLVIFLHGAGERGNDNQIQLVHGMADFCKPQRRKNYRCYVLAPQCPKEKRWVDIDWNQDHLKSPKDMSVQMSLLFQIVDTMVEQAAVDKRRIYITGLSMGGYGTWDAIYRRPELFAAAAPICGGADPDIAQKIKDIPIWNFHGGADKVVKVEYSQRIIEALKQLDAEPRYTEYEGVGHDSWTATYANEELYQWMFAQRKKVDIAPTDKVMKEKMKPSP